MVYIKMDSDFFSIEELAKLSKVSASQIELCVDRGLLDNDEVVERYFPEKINTVVRLKSAFSLLRRSSKANVAISAHPQVNSLDEDF